ncbi:unnamed protein product [Rotaria sp. Silwood2]|nr:unnamed protein product [Rotaria sp. Silwood2]CAF2777519.1 unnamed protein product [Rotaria sp. Silwood2]CAF2985052.1 unnamed protein product [Rotaria sp. Silwood2]CAF3141200.1 unnamed protein product [Rotaria sp. Silwood2]CAF3995204.1 unnamed protein product [Rotaria sp. Silwood2]
MSTLPLSNTLRQLHVKIADCDYSKYVTEPITDLLVKMTNLHTLTFVDIFFALSRIEWTFFEMLTSSNTMPVLQRANICLIMNVNDLNCIAPSPIFNDDRHADINFAFSIIDCPAYLQMTQYIPRGSHCHPRELIGATCVIKYEDKSTQSTYDADPYCHGQEYHQHIWYTLPWAFDEFFQ